MVRLKVQKFPQEMARLIMVSIPYGSIKRDVGKVLPQMSYNVSIPYGSIKSFPALCHSFALTSFNSLWFD